MLQPLRCTCTNSPATACIPANSAMELATSISEHCDATELLALRARCAKSGRPGHVISACQGTTVHSQPAENMLIKLASSFPTSSGDMKPALPKSCFWGDVHLAFTALTHCAVCPQLTVRYRSPPVIGASKPPAWSTRLRLKPIC